MSQSHLDLFRSSTMNMVYVKVRRPLDDNWERKDIPNFIVVFVVLFCLFAWCFVFLFVLSVMVFNLSLNFIFYCQFSYHVLEADLQICLNYLNVHVYLTHWVVSKAMSCIFIVVFFCFQWFEEKKVINVVDIGGKYWSSLYAWRHLNMV